MSTPKGWFAGAASIYLLILMAGAGVAAFQSGNSVAGFAFALIGLVIAVAAVSRQPAAQPSLRRTVGWSSAGCLVVGISAVTLGVLDRDATRVLALVAGACFIGIGSLGIYGLWTFPDRDSAPPLKSGGAGERSIREPNWGRVGLIYAVIYVAALGLIKLAQLPPEAVVGGAIGLGILLPQLLYAQWKGYREWAEEDQSPPSSSPSSGAS